MNKHQASISTCCLLVNYYENIAHQLQKTDPNFSTQVLPEIWPLMKCSSFRRIFYSAHYRCGSASSNTSEQLHEWTRRDVPAVIK